MQVFVDNPGSYLGRCLVDHLKEMKSSTPDIPDVKIVQVRTRVCAGLSTGHTPIENNTMFTADPGQRDQTTSGVEHKRQTTAYQFFETSRCHNSRLGGDTQRRSVSAVSMTNATTEQSKCSRHVEASRRSRAPIRVHNICSSLQTTNGSRTGRRQRRSCRQVFCRWGNKWSSDCPQCFAGATSMVTTRRCDWRCCLTHTTDSEWKEEEWQNRAVPQSPHYCQILELEHELLSLSSPRAKPYVIATGA